MTPATSRTALLAVTVVVTMVALASGPARAADAPTTARPPISGSSIGPTSDAEATILWQDARAGFEAHRDDEAIPRLERFVDRYPGKPGYLEAHLLLGIARVRVGLPQQALEPLRYYVGATGDVVDRAKGRLWIGHARIALSQYTEALLTAREILDDRHARRVVGPVTEAQAILLQGEARAGLGQDVEAAASVESARQVLDAAPAKPASVRPKTQVRGRADALELKLKRRLCARFASAAQLDEAQVIDQFDRRTVCARQAAVIARRALEAGDDEASDLAAAELIGLARDLHSAARNPPAPPALKPRARSRAETERYLKELAQTLAARAAAATADMRLKLEETRPQLPPVSQPRLDRITQALQGLSS